MGLIQQPVGYLPIDNLPIMRNPVQRYEQLSKRNDRFIQRYQTSSARNTS